MAGGVKGTVPRKRAGSTIEQPDELIYISRDERGEIVDVGIEEFVDLERKDGKTFKLTLTGRDEKHPIVLVIESNSRITVREMLR